MPTRDGIWGKGALWWVWFPFALITGSIALWLGFSEVRDEYLLETESKTTDGVIASVRFPKNGGLYVFYEFLAAPDSERFHRKDWFGGNRGTDVSSLSQLLGDTSRIRVRYLRRDPWVNRPADESGTGPGSWV